RGVDVALRGIDRARGGGAGHGHAGAHGAGAGDRGLQLALRLLERDLVVGGIDLHEHRARLDVLVVLRVDRLHRAAHARGGRVDGAVDLRVVGRLLPAAEEPEGEASHHDEHGHAEEDPSLEPAARALLGRLLFLWLRHQCPRMNCWKPCSATPSARASEAQPRLTSYVLAMRSSCAVATACWAWTTSRLLATPASKRSRACWS